MRVRAFIIGLGLVFAASMARAALPLSGYNLTAWTQKDGLAPSLVWALAQDQDGYLWLGTDAGLLRFDGVRFVSWEAIVKVPDPHASIRSLLVAQDGALWVGLGEPGGIAVIRRGVVTALGADTGLPPGLVNAIVETADGIHAAGRFGLFRYDGARWRDDGAGLPPGAVNAVAAEASGRLTVATGAGVFARPGQGAAFARVGPSPDLARDVARDARGRLWTTDTIVGWRAVEARAQPKLQGLPGRGSRLLHDSRNNLWIGTGGQGLWRYRPDGVEPAPLERTSTALGLSDDGVTDLLEDRDGNIWVATRDGLNRLTPYKMTPLTDLGLASAIEATPDGDVYVGTAESVVPFEGGRPEGRRPPIPLAAPLTAMHADRDGVLWVATARDLWRIRNGREERLPLRGMHVESLSDMTSDGAGGLWLHDERRGLYHWQAGALNAVALPPSLATSPLLASYTDKTGRAWLSFEGSQVVAIDPAGAVQVYGPQHGLTAGPYRAIHEDAGGGLWLGGSALTRFAEGAFTTLAPLAGEADQVITAIVDDSSGALWVAISAAGIIRITRAELALSLVDRLHAPRFTAYDKVDGSAGTSRWFGNRAGVRSGADALWFVAGRGVTFVDASTLPARSPLPADRVRIEAVVADGRQVDLQGRRELPPRTARVQLEYTALNLTAPHRTRFRYRLEGFDADWVEAGGRHSAFYTNLPPREYTFKVVSSGPDGSFAAAPAEWRFSVRPMFYQTWWFALVCLGSVVLGTAAAWRVHVHRVRTQFVLLLKERARLSREVHDTLLQSMFGVALECDALQASAPPGDPEFRERLRRLRRRVEGDIRDARQSIWNLRSPRLEKQGLPSALREVGRQMLEPTGLRFQFQLDGVPRETAADVDEQLMRIGSEAIANVVRHAQASEVVVELTYQPQAVMLTVRDDGRGFEPGRPAAGGHIGLTTMKERVTSVGGTLRVDTEPGRGTTVVATVPGKAA